MPIAARRSSVDVAAKPFAQNTLKAASNAASRSNSLGLAMSIKYGLRTDQSITILANALMKAGQYRVKYHVRSLSHVLDLRIMTSPLQDRSWQDGESFDSYDQFVSNGQLPDQR